MPYTNFDLVEEYGLGDGEIGLRARTDIAEGVIIGIYDGVLRQFALKDGRMVDNEMHKSAVQIAVENDTIFSIVTAGSGPFEGIDYVNHSCHPNIVVRDRVVMIASRPIAKGEPLTVDYREWDFVHEGVPCWCSPSRCVI